MLSVVLTMLSLVLTSFRGKYIEFQFKMVYGKRVSVSAACVGTLPHGNRAYHGKRRAYLF